MAQSFDVAMRTDVVFADHDGTKLLGDLYLPKGVEKAPALVAVHGGGWQIGDRKFYTHWGAYLARNGYAVFAIEYRLMKPGVKSYPGAVCDVKAAVQYVRANAAEFGIDPQHTASALAPTDNPLEPTTNGDDADPLPHAPDLRHVLNVGVSTPTSQVTEAIIPARSTIWSR